MAMEIKDLIETDTGKMKVGDSLDSLGWQSFDVDNMGDICS